MRRAKIVCTLGPAVAGVDRIRQLVEAGMDVARMNFSHGDHADHEQNFADVRAAAEATGRNVAVLLDLQGPKIRLGRFAEGAVELEVGAEFVITTEDVEGDVHQCSTTYKGLPGDVSVGDTILIDDGRLALRATGVDGPRVTTEVVVGGRVSNNKGINLPGVAVSVPALTEKDIEDLRFGLGLGVDIVALSFVRRGSDVDGVRRVMEEEGVRRPVIAKVEKPQAVEHLREVIDAFDGIMVARGDLGVELPLYEVPLVQKRAVELARRQAKPVIVATQMLESMISSPRPTRAEASDVANAILDGADAVMLSGETSVGEFPFEAVRTMADIIRNTEEHGLDRIAPLGTKPRTKGGAITRAAAEIGAQLNVRYLACFSQSGDSAKRMSRLRSPIPLLVFTPSAEARRQLAVSWGIEAIETPMVTHTDDMVRQVDEAMRNTGLGADGDLVVIVAGSPPGIPGSTNALRVHQVGDAVAQVAPAYAT
ncbi:pyruvate kinase [Aquipuribacter nitratireducens]|uniref:Pyruvate kinase n=1 Tax=Aquipuribacter nitratireducens TaxID=650104 RepID=A0ABW0GKQ5_9MICO